MNLTWQIIFLHFVKTTNVEQINLKHLTNIYNTDLNKNVL